MAFGIKRHELVAWKKRVKRGEIAFLTHYWYDERFPQYKTVTKVGCIELDKLIGWGKQYGLHEKWIHHNKNFPHFDLLGDKQKEILIREQLQSHIEQFNL